MYQAAKAGTALVQKSSLFRVPRDAERLKLWNQAIQHEDRNLHESSVVCERHFESHFIKRAYTMVIQDELIEVPRDAPILANDAVPTLVLYKTTSLSKDVLHRKRRHPSACDDETELSPTKKQASEELLVDVNTSNSSHSCDSAVFREFSGLHAPSPWTRVHLEETTEQITFAHCHLTGDGLLDSLHVSRRVVLDFKAHSISAHATVYIRGEKTEARGS